LLIVRYQHLHSHLSHDHQLDGPQKFHIKPVPRIGGLSIASGLLCSLLIALLQNSPYVMLGLLFLGCASLPFGIGLLEDVSKAVSIRTRLIIIGIGATLLIFILPLQVASLDIPIFDEIFLIPWISIAFTIFAITGLTNAYNIIDGFNGLASMVAIITLIAITYVSFTVGDFQIIYLALIGIGAILGFFLWNYPRGLIFLGDGGAYLIGFWIASLSIFLVERHSEISPWFALLVNAYPIIETLFSIYRRKIHQNKNPGHPDGVHLHSLIFRRLSSRGISNQSDFSGNAKTSPYLWSLAGLGCAPAVLWWNSTAIQMIAFIIFTFIYIWLYSRIVLFQTPAWLHFFY